MGAIYPDSDSGFIGVYRIGVFDKTVEKEMKIKFCKLYDHATLPTRATDGSAGFDLTAMEAPIYDARYGVYSYDTGIAVEIPKGYVGLLVPRSSVYKIGLSLCNSCGIIDSDYRGPISFKFYQIIGEDEDYLPKKGDRMGQLVVVPCLTEAEEVSELSETVRGHGGFGSTGKHTEFGEKLIERTKTIRDWYLSPLSEDEKKSTEGEDGSI